MFAFLYVKVNSKKVCEEIYFPAFFKKMLMSAFLLGFKANYLEKNAWLPLFCFVDSNSPCKDILFPRGPSLAQNPLYLVGTVLKHFFKESVDYQACLIIKESAFTRSFKRKFNKKSVGLLEQNTKAIQNF